MGNRRPTIRRATRADLDALVALEEASFDHDRVSRTQWHRHLRGESACVLVAERTGMIAGCALVFFRRGSRRARLYSIAVAEHARGSGLGTALLDAAECEAKRRGCGSIHLEARTDNIPALALYEKHGYRRQARVPRFYENGMDAWRCGKLLNALR